MRRLQRRRGQGDLRRRDDGHVRAQHLHPIAKATGGILVLDKQDAASVEEGPCLRCGKCVEVCPIGLHPLKIKIAADADRIDECKQLHVLDCTLCGSCSFICPAHRWLTASFKVAKQKLAAQAKKGGSGK